MCKDNGRKDLFGPAIFTAVLAAIFVKKCGYRMGHMRNLLLIGSYVSLIV